MISSARLIFCIKPCNKGFINAWKATSYCASFASAIIVIFANQLGSQNFPKSSLFPALFITWILLIFAFVFMYHKWNANNYVHYKRLDNLVFIIVILN